jgi:transcriptional regulator of acetoin/glycerol metabolism
MAHDWPGNVRELNNCLIHYIVHGALPPLCCAGGGSDWQEGLRDALIRHQGNVSAVAREVGKSRTTVYEALEQRGISPKVLGRVVLELQPAVEASCRLSGR